MLGVQRGVQLLLVAAHKLGAVLTSVRMKALPSSGFGFLVARPWSTAQSSRLGSPSLIMARPSRRRLRS